MTEVIFYCFILLILDTLTKLMSVKIFWCYCCWSIYGTMMLPIDSMRCQFSGASLHVLYTHVTQVRMKGSDVF